MLHIKSTKLMKTNELTFEALINYHKMEGQEEIAYLAIMFTVIIGIIGYLGSAQKVEKSARILILLFYIGFHFAMVSSFLASMKIHGAIHKEIATYVIENPEIFNKGTRSCLYNELKEMKPHNVGRMELAGHLLLVFMILCILSLGSNSILRWTRIENIFIRGKTTK